jgi:chromate transporter
MVRNSEIAAVFFRLGVTAFGGPAAHLAMMQEEIVEKRKWITHDELLDLISAANLIPGPNSTEVAIHIGRRVGGVPGLLIAGACFIVPAALITLALAYLYVRFGKLPRAMGFFYGVKPVVVAIVARALIELAKKAIKTPLLGVIAAVAVVASFLSVHELLVLLGAGLLALPQRRSMNAVAPLSLFLVFLKIGSVLFGSGYVLIAFLRSDLVLRYKWLSDAQLLDAVAAGQLTPGPVFTTATFVGYTLGGFSGALAATAGIFLPAFVFVALTAPFVTRLRSSAVAGRFLDGVNAASLALMFVAAARLAIGSIVGVVPAILMIAAFFLRRVNSAWLVLAGGGVGVAYVGFMK